MRFGLTALVALVATALCPVPAHSQTSGPAGQTPQHRTPDFLFGRPKGMVSIRAGRLFASANSDWYGFVSDQLTLAKDDFNGPGFATDVAVALTSRLDAVGGFEFTQSSHDSEYRRLVDNNRLPIEQTTRLRQASLTGGLKLALTERGRQVSSLVWVPPTMTPYVVAGAGVMHFDLQQTGDFVDFVDLSVFTDVFRSKGWAPTAHAGAGLDVKLTRRLYATVDGRYLWAAGDLGRDWIDFEKIDLAGFRVSAGVSLLF
jgi:hypothetical protein